MLCNLLVPVFYPNVYLMAVAWGVNGFFQALIRPPLGRIIAANYDEKGYIDTCVSVSNSSQAATVLTYLLIPLYLRCFDQNWRPAFFLPAVVTAITLGLWIFLVPRIISPMSAAAAEEKTVAAEKKAAPKKKAVSETNASAAETAVPTEKVTKKKAAATPPPADGGFFSNPGPAPHIPQEAAAFEPLPTIEPEPMPRRGTGGYTARSTMANVPWRGLFRVFFFLLIIGGIAALIINLPTILAAAADVAVTLLPSILLVGGMIYLLRCLFRGGK
jgi:hypothetical protein